MYKKIFGMTLIELMVAMTIMGIIGLGMVQLLSSITRFQTMTVAQIGVQRDARMALEIIKRQIRETKQTSVIIDRENSSQPFCSRIYFKDANDNEIYFYQVGKKIYMKTKKTGWPSWNTKEIAKDLRYLTFCYQDTRNPDLISVSLCFEKIALGSNTKFMHLSIEKVRLMN
ncbi:MAG: hypothetical protein COY53_09070 [Elusimicrobia bacterium CG_4_10_14_0_8_um_filter_37_32]|nr:MAG: hypothetical protein COY53_09070 [Elusimicrobia bacterium CG_4_10_14_0_8_um_filter_37_32]